MPISTDTNKDTKMHSRTDKSANIPLPVQIISIVFYAAFAISVSITTIAIFWPAGVFLAAIFAYQWGRIPSLGGRPANQDVSDKMDEVKPQTNFSFNKSSGNQSFDAYREDLLRRLEQERDSFRSFVERVREAEDENEFDKFMTDRAEAAKIAAG